MVTATQLFYFLLLSTFTTSPHEKQLIAWENGRLTTKYLQQLSEATGYPHECSRGNGREQTVQGQEAAGGHLGFSQPENTGPSKPPSQ